jgi:hypothetical protein
MDLSVMDQFFDESSSNCQKAASAGFAAPIGGGISSAGVPETGILAIAVLSI